MNELETDLGKLKRNELQMTEAQKKQYAKPLKALKAKILKNADKALNDFLNSAIGPVKESTLESFDTEIKRIIEFETSKGTFKNIVNTLFVTYSVDEFLKAASPVYYRIHYEVYAPYWVKHCKEIGKVDKRYYNDLIDAEYIKEFNIWHCKAKKEFSAILPPTMEEINKEYQKEMEAWRQDVRKV